MGAAGWRCPVSIAIPTYCREQVLVDTVEALLRLKEPAAEMLVLDQTPAHEVQAEVRLRAWEDAGDIRWVRLAAPSIPAAMNEGLRIASQRVVLFLDDDIEPLGELVRAHADAHEGDDCAAVNGQILQPGEEESGGRPSDPNAGLRRDLGFRFNSCEPARAIASCMAGNLSVKKDAALSAGGFDERFIGTAYRFETEFCRRLARTGGRTKYEPRAKVRHLRAKAGGTRAWGDHLVTMSPAASVGDYYFALLEGRGLETWTYAVARLFREVRTRFHLRHPWLIPAKLVGEVRGLWMAINLYRGRRRR